METNEIQEIQEIQDFEIQDEQKEEFEDVWQRSGQLLSSAWAFNVAIHNILLPKLQNIQKFQTFSKPIF